MTDKKQAQDEALPDLNSLMAFSYDPLKNILADILKKQKNHDGMLQTILSDGLANSQNTKPSSDITKELDKSVDDLIDKLGDLHISLEKL